MTGLSVLFGEANSLRRGLVVNILLAVGFCFALASVILTYEFYEHLANNRNGALAREAAEIAGQISPAAPELGLDAGALRFQGDAGLYRYTVFDGAMRPVIGGEVVDGLADRVPDAATGKPRFLTLGDTRTAAALTVERDGRRFVVLVSTAARRSGKSDLAKLTHEITEEIHWLAIGIAAI
ncbi:MAG: hypothetical protein ACU0EF_10065, partial [Roseovarius sp.]